MQQRRPNPDRQGRQPRPSIGKRLLRYAVYRLIQLTLLLVGSAALVAYAAQHFQRAHDPNVDAINLEIASSRFDPPVKSHLDATLRAIGSFNQRVSRAVSTVSNVERGTKITERAATEVKLHNAGAQEISYVKWECMLFDPKDADHPIQRLSFETDQQEKPIRAGESRTFRREFTLRQQLPDGVRSRFRIVRVNYANGDNWQRPDSR